MLTLYDNHRAASTRFPIDIQLHRKAPTVQGSEVEIEPLASGCRRRVK